MKRFSPGWFQAGGMGGGGARGGDLSFPEPPLPMQSKCLRICVQVRGALGHSERPKVPVPMKERAEV